MASAPVSAADPALPGDRDIDLRYYAGLLWRHRAFLGACALVGLLLGLVVALVQTPEYRAAVLLQIEPPPPTFASVSDALLVGAGNYWQNTDFYNTQFKVLRSKGLGEKVVARLKLTDREPFKSSADAGHALHEPRGGRARPGEPARLRDGHPPRAARGGPVGQHPRRRLHRAVARQRASSRPARRWSGSRSASPTPRRACGRPRTSSSRATGPRTSSCPTAASPPSPPRSPSSTRTSCRPRPGGSPSRRRSSRRGRCRPAARTSTSCPRSPSTPR